MRGANGILRVFAVAAVAAALAVGAVPAPAKAASLSGPATSAPTPTEGDRSPGNAGEARVLFKDGTFSIDANQATVGALFQRITEVSGFPIHVPGDARLLSTTVTVSFETKRFKDSLECISHAAAHEVLVRRPRGAPGGSSGAEIFVRFAPSVSEKSVRLPADDASPCGCEQRLVKEGLEFEAAAQKCGTLASCVQYEFGDTPLQKAASQGDVEAVAKLLDGCYPVDEKGIDCRTALFHAARTCKEEAAAMLLARGANPRAPVRHDDPFSEAMRKCGPEMVAIFLDAGAGNLSSLGREEAAALRATDNLAVIAKRRPDLIRSAFFAYSLAVAAIEANSLDPLKLLLDNGLNPDARGYPGQPVYGTPLHVAVGKKNAGAIGLLLDHGADINARASGGMTALHGAAGRGDMEMTRLLLDRGADIEATDEHGCGITCAAAVWGRAEVIKLLVQRGAKVKGLHPGSLPPVFVSSGKPEILNLLLGLGADVHEIWGDRGQTVLHLILGPDPNGRSDDPRKIAEDDSRRLPRVQALLGAGADPNARDAAGATPLHYAIENGLARSVSLLLAKGADPNLPDHSGATPLSIAARKRRADIATALVQAGAGYDGKPQGGVTVWPPAIEVAPGGRATVRLSWLRVPGASGYTLYRSQARDDVGAVRATTDKEGYEDEVNGGGLYCYWLKSLSEKGASVLGNPTCADVDVASASGEQAATEDARRHIEYYLRWKEELISTTFYVGIKEFADSIWFITRAQRNLVPGLGTTFIRFPNAEVARLDPDTLARAFILKGERSTEAQAPETVIADYVRTLGGYEHGSDEVIPSLRSIPQYCRHPLPEDEERSASDLRDFVTPQGERVYERLTWARYGGALRKFRFVFGADGRLADVQVKTIAKPIGAAEYYL